MHNCNKWRGGVRLKVGSFATWNTSTNSSIYQHAFHPVLGAARQCQILFPGAIIFGQNLLELLTQSNSDVGCFSKCILLSKAYSWTAVEGKILPSGSQSLPSFRSEVFSVFTKIVLASVHGVRCVYHKLPLWNEKGRFAVWTTSQGKHSICHCRTGIRWYHWM